MPSGEVGLRKRFARQRAEEDNTFDRSDRCHGGRYELLHLWPPRPARTTSIRRLRASLVDALGPDCHLCGLYPGAMVDHDHQTGQVRGLLCAYCNRVLEECPHLSGCPKADYLLSPPAAGLKLLYPTSQQSRPKESTRQRKIKLLGFDPFEGLHPGLDSGDVSDGKQVGLTTDPERYPLPFRPAQQTRQGNWPGKWADRPPFDL
ncbi:endonuclease domain-containing protein [Streptomyces sp. NPDC004069]